MAKRIQPINPGAPQPVPEAAPPPSLPGFGRPINLVQRVAPKAIQAFPSMGRRLRDPNAIPLAGRADIPVPEVPPIEPYPLAGGPDLSPIPVDQGLGATPADQRLGKFAEPAATPPPAPGAYNAVRNAGRGPAMPFVKPGTALALPNPAGPPATIPGRPAIPMGGPAPPAPPPQGQLPGSTQRSLPAPGPAQPARPAIPMGGANAYTPPNAGGTSEAIGGATPNRPGKFAGSLRPPPANGFNIVREPLGLPGPGRAPVPPPQPPPQVDPFDMRTAQRGGNFSRAGVQTPGSLRTQMGVAPSLRTAPAPSRIASTVRSVGPMIALEAAANPEGFAHALGHPIEAAGNMLGAIGDGFAGLADGRFRAGAGRLMSGDRLAWKEAVERSPLFGQVIGAGQNMGRGAAEWMRDPAKANAAFQGGIDRLGSAFMAPSAPPSPPAPQAPDINPNGLSPEFEAQVRQAGGDPANYAMAGGMLVSLPGTKPPAPMVPSQPGPGATADQMNAFFQSQGVGAGAKGPVPAAPTAPPAPTVIAASLQPTSAGGRGAAMSPEQRQTAMAHRTISLLNRQMAGLQEQFDRYQNPEMRAGIAHQMAGIGAAIAQQQQVATQLGTAPAERRLMDARATQAENDNRPPGEKLDAIMKDSRTYEAFLISKGVKPEEVPAYLERYRANSQATPGGQGGGPIDQQSYLNVLRGNQYLEGLRPHFDPTHAGYNPNASLTGILDRAMMYPGANDPNSPVAQVIREGVRGRYPGDALGQQAKGFRNNPNNWFFGDSARDAKYRTYLRSIGLNELPAS